MIAMKPVNSLMLIALILLVPVALVAGCTSGSSATDTPSATATPAATVTPAATAKIPTAAPVPGNNVALQIRGMVSHPVNYSIGELRSYPSFNATVLFKDNNTYDLNGISLNRLLNDSAVSADATSINLIASDGYLETVSLSDIRASKDAMVHIGGGLPVCCASDGLSGDELKAILPGLPFKTWASQLIAVEVV
jgi:hypothetical protein